MAYGRSSLCKASQSLLCNYCVFMPRSSVGIDDGCSVKIVDEFCGPVDVCVDGDPDSDATAGIQTVVGSCSVA